MLINLLLEAGRYAANGKAISIYEDAICSEE